MAIFVTVNNPFDRAQDSIKQDESQTVLQYLKKVFPGFIQFNKPIVCCINSEPVLRKDWESRLLKKSDVVSFIPVVGEPLTITLIAISVIAVAASLVVTLTMPTPKPRTPGQIDQPESVYSLRGQYNQFRLGQPIEVCYGRVRRWPSYAASSYNKYINNDQFLYSLFCIGQGEYSVSNILLEDTESLNFPESEFSIVEPDSEVTLFENNVVTSSEVAGLELFGPNEDDYDSWSGPFILNPSGTTTDRVELDFTLPQGLYLSNGSGGLDTISVEFEVEFQKVDSDGVAVGSWINPSDNMRVNTYTRVVIFETNAGFVYGSSWAFQGSTWGASDGLGDPGETINSYEDFYNNGVNFNSGGSQTWTEKIYTQSMAYSDRTNTPLRFTEEYGLPEAARWQVRARRTNDKNTSHLAGNTLKWDSARAFLPSSTSFGNVTLLAFKARATNNLNDNLQQRINVFATRKLPLWDSETGWSEPTETRSIVAAFCDVFRSTYGAGLSDSLLNLTELWGTFEPFYDGRGEYFDYIFASKTTVLEAAKTIARAGRAIPMIVGTQLTMIRDGSASVPTMLFGPHNIIKGSFEWEIRLYDDTEPDAVEVVYTDPQTFNEETILCGLDDDPAEPTRPERVELPGVTDRNVAYQEGLYLRATQRHVREQVNFKTGLQGRIPPYGALIGVAHDLPQWGQSGQIKSIGGTLITSLNPLTWADGETHQIAFVNRYGATVGPYTVTQGAESNKLVLSSALDSGVLASLVQDDDGTGHPSMFLFGVTNDFYRLMKITGIRNGGNDQVSISAVDYSAIPHSFDGVSAPAKTAVSAVLTLPDVPTMSGVRVESLTNTLATAIIKWEPVLGAKKYTIEQSFNSGSTWIAYSEVTTSFDYIPVTPGRMNIRVAAVNQGQSAFETWVGVVGVIRLVDDEFGNTLVDQSGNVLYEPRDVLI